MARSLVRCLILVTAFALAAGDLSAQAGGDALRQRLRQITSLEQSGQLVRAYSELQVLLRDYPAEAGVVLAYERVCRRLGTLADALPAIERAIEINPDNPTLWQAQLRVLGELGQTDRLIDEGERWLVVAPQLETAYHDYAQALRRVGEFERAEAVLLIGQDRANSSGMLTVALADIYLAEARWADAVEHWLALLESAPSMGWDVVVSRFESRGQDQIVVAVAVLDVIGVEPPSVAHASLGAIAALYADDPQTARRMADRALRDIEPAQQRVFIDGFASLAVRRDQPSLVAWTYRHLLRELPNDANAFDLAKQIVQHDLSAGDTSAAIEILYDFIADAQPGSTGHQWAAAVWVRLVAARGDANRASDALEDYARLYSADPELSDLALIVAEAFLREGKPDESRRVLELVSAELADRDVRAHMSAVRAYLALYAGEYDEARTQFETAAATLTGSERSEAIRLLRLLRHASEPELEAVSAAHVALIQHQPAQAFERLLSGLEDARPSAARPALLVWAGELAIESGAVERAEAVLLRVPELYPESGEAPLALMKLAEALAAVDRKDDAIVILETLIIDYPESALTPIGRRRLAELREELPRS